MYNIASSLNLGVVVDGIYQKSCLGFKTCLLTCATFTRLPVHRSITDLPGLSVPTFHFVYELIYFVYELIHSAQNLTTCLNFFLKPITALSPYQAEFLGLGPYDLLSKSIYARPYHNQTLTA
jgi:hypothetical protein